MTRKTKRLSTDRDSSTKYAVAYASALGVPKLSAIQRARASPTPSQRQLRTSAWRNAVSLVAHRQIKRSTTIVPSTQPANTAQSAKWADVGMRAVVTWVFTKRHQQTAARPTIRGDRLSACGHAKLTRRSWPPRGHRADLGSIDCAGDARGWGVGTVMRSRGSWR
jgi:hypothetical protein